MFVKDVMTENPVTVEAGASFKTGLRLLARYGVTSLPVVATDGRICGVVSESDLIRESIRPDPRMDVWLTERETIAPPHTVDEVLTAHPIVVHPEDDLAVAVELMTSTRVKSLPVVDHHDRPIGMVSRSDVVRSLARADTDIEGQVDDLLRTLGGPDWLVEVNDGIVEISGPASPGELHLARAVAGMVPGVIDVRIV
ncbi:CBS domain-containing protein [Nocardioides jensenii]|uniref:CBS domain-containing protein n=1 Tax=Nocardioides jensenii TaxID=1843 RepID=UPI00082E19F6|nr:CBS domain-containing protein [Nocardioides jensenii]